MDRPFNRPKVIIYRFVDVLITAGRLKFDYVNIASRHLAEFIDEFYNEPQMIDLMEELREWSSQDYDITERRSPTVFKRTQPQPTVRDSLCLYMNWRMKLGNKARIGFRHNASDHKLIRWVVAYALAKEKAVITVHERFAQALKQRSQEGIKQYIYSRMTRCLVDLDRRLLALTTQGDLTQFVDGFFNSAINSPTNKESYKQISQALKVAFNEMLVVSTNLDECLAASAVGCVVAKVKRPGEPKNRTYPRVQDMSYIVLVERELIKQPVPVHSKSANQAGKRKSKKVTGSKCTTSGTSTSSLSVDSKKGHTNNSSSLTIVKKKSSSLPKVTSSKKSSSKKSSIPTQSSGGSSTSLSRASNSSDISAALSPTSVGSKKSAPKGSSSIATVIPGHSATRT